MSVGIKNNVEKDSSLLFFLSKSPDGHAISRQIHLELPVVSYGRMVTWLPKFLRWMDYQIFLGRGLRYNDYNGEILMK